MKLSIIIPVYKVEKFIKKCLESTQNQDVSTNEYEVIVVNDGSPDNSLDIAIKFSKQHPNVIVISQENGGLSSARNAGIRKAKGKYLFFLDSDDWMANNCLGRIIKQLDDECPDILRISSAIYDNEKIIVKESFVGWNSMTGREALKKGLSPCAQYSIVKKDFLTKHNLWFYNGILHEDSEFTPRMHYLAEKMSFTAEIIYCIYQNPNSITHTINPKRSFDLINVVCPRLSDFSNCVELEYVHVFHSLISMYINNAIYYILDSDELIQNEFNKVLYNQKNIFVHLAHSLHFKYRLEAFLFKLFPKHYVNVYKFICKFNSLVKRLRFFEVRK